MTRKKSLAGWVRRHRQSIDEAIRAECSNLGRLSDEDRAEWVANLESLYLWAVSDGVEV